MFFNPSAEKEILQVNYGLCRALQLAETGAYSDIMICAYCALPDFSLASQLTKKNFPTGVIPRSFAAGLSGAQFLAYGFLRKNFIKRMPAATTYLVGSDFRKSLDYVHAVNSFYDALRDVRRLGHPNEVDVEAQSPAGRAFSDIMRMILTVARSRSRESIPLFDNCIPGPELRFIDCLDPTQIGPITVISVRRDPRDQFIERVENSLTTSRFSVKKFVHRYELQTSLGRRHVQKINLRPSCHAFFISFEDFTRNREGLRDRIAAEIESIHGVRLPAALGPKFRPEASEKNIGLWRHGRLRSQIDYIERTLGGFLIN